MIRQEIIKMLKKAVEESGFKVSELVVEHSAKAGFGDYATNVVLQIAKTTGFRPQELADILISKLKANKDLFENIEVARPGFLNLFISKEYLQEQVADILGQKDKFGSLEIG